MIQLGRLAGRTKRGGFNNGASDMATMWVKPPLAARVQACPGKRQCQ